MTKRVLEQMHILHTGLMALATFIRFLRWVIITRTLAGAAVFILGLVLIAYNDLPEPSALFDGRTGGSVVLLDREGEMFAARGELYGGALRAEDAAPYLLDAVLAVEDRRFLSHFGLDPKGIARAMVANYNAGRIVQGGSTITQQAAKLLFFTNERSFERHLKQIPIVLAMEWKYSKEDILSIYLNRTYLGAGAVGFEAAAQNYFGVSAREVTLPQAAMLAGLLKAPSTSAPTRNLAAAQSRANLVITLMEHQGRITADEARLARENPAFPIDQATETLGHHFADWSLANVPHFLTHEGTEDVVLATTFDPQIQRIAQEAVQEVLTNEDWAQYGLQAAVVVMDPDGAVRAIVGGRDDLPGGVGSFNRATQALRQTGSAFKPFVYAAALDLGHTPETMVPDAPITIDVPGSGEWTPKNYSGRFEGLVTLREALARSLNTPAVRIERHLGDAPIREAARALGIRSPLSQGPAFVLGVSEANVMEMTGAFAGFLAQGRRVDPYAIQSLTLKGDQFPIMERLDGRTSDVVLTERTALMMMSMLQSVVEEGSGRRAAVDNHEAAGKTGTSQNNRDAWFVGFTSHYVAGVWVGPDQGRGPDELNGASAPSEIWGRIMNEIHKDRWALPLNPRADALDSGGLY